MSKDNKIQGLQRERAYLSALLEETTKELARLDLLNLTLTQQERQAIAAFNFIKIMHEKIEKALTIDALYANVVRAITSDLFMDSSALLRINYKTRDVSLLASAGLPETFKDFKLDKGISKQKILKPTFVNSKSSLRSFHTFVRNCFKFPYFVWYPFTDEEDGMLVLFAGNKFEDLVSKQPFSETSLETFGAISSVILLRRDNIANIQEILRAKEGRIDFLAEIVKTAPISVIATDWDGKIIYVNPATEKLFGYKAKELTGKYPVMLNAEPNAVEMHREIMGTVRQGKIWRGEILNRRKNGDLFHAHHSIYQLLDREGNFIALVDFQRDITERKNAVKALRESEEKFRNLAEQSPNMIFINKRGRVVYANEKCEEVMGYKREEFYSPDFSFLTLIAPEFVNLIKEKFRKHMQGKEVAPYEYALVTKEGRRIEAIVTTKLIAYEGEKAVLGIVTDITERKQAERASREAQRFLEAVVETAPSLIVLTDLDGRIILFNRACEELTGYKREEVLGKTISELFLSPEWVPIVQKRFANPYALEVCAPHENPWITKSGEKRLIEWRCTVLSPQDGRSCILGTGIDITERKQAHEQLQSLSRRLVEVQDTYHHDLARELHDRVGQNLTALSINLNIMYSELSKKLHNRVTARLEDSLKLVEELIERIRNVMAELRPPVLDDYGLVAALRWYSERFSERTGISTVLQGEELFPRLPLSVETALFNIVQEVLTNVAKHAQAKQVNIVFNEIEEIVQVTITDDGVGFDPLHSRQLKDQPGWGLITMEERAKALSGHVFVESSPGKGTRIVVEVKR